MLAEEERELAELDLLLSRSCFQALRPPRFLSTLRFSKSPARWGWTMAPTAEIAACSAAECFRTGRGDRE